MYLRFKNKIYGICTILSVKGRLSLIKLGKRDKFLVASDLNIRTGNWEYGNYFNKIEDADDFFEEILQFKSIV